MLLLTISIHIGLVCLENKNLLENLKINNLLKAKINI